MVRTTIGNPIRTATHVSAGDARTALTARNRTIKAKDDNAARPTGDVSMNGYTSTPVSWTARSTADGCRQMRGTQPVIDEQSTGGGVWRTVREPRQRQCWGWALLA